MCSLKIATTISGTHGTEILKANTKPSEISSPDKSKPPSGNPKLGRSKTERQKHNICAEEAAKIFDNKIPVQKKVQFYNGLILLSLFLLLEISNSYKTMVHHINAVQTLIQ